MTYAISFVDDAARWAGEHSIRKAVTKFGITEGTIRKGMIRLGISRRRAGNLDTYPPALRSKAVAMYRAGRSSFEVEEKTGIPHRYVTELARKAVRRENELKETAAA